MQQITVLPTDVDERVARAAARHTTPGVQTVARAATWGADEHVMCSVAAAYWVISRKGTRRQRVEADHLLATVAAATLLPHGLKKIFHQERPDRSMVGADRQGVGKSGGADNAFPSGHAVHIGAVAGALSWIYPEKSRLIWGVGAALAGTRVAVLAHWVSDVAVGLALGTGLERALRQEALRRMQRTDQAVHSGRD